MSMENINLIEFFSTAIAAVLAFFVNRMLAGYDRRITQIEEKQDKIQKHFTALDKHVATLDTRLEMRDKSESS